MTVILLPRLIKALNFYSPWNRFRHQIWMTYYNGVYKAFELGTFFKLVVTNVEVAKTATRFLA